MIPESTVYSWLCHKVIHFALGYALYLTNQQSGELNSIHLKHEKVVIQDFTQFTFRRITSVYEIDIISALFSV